MKESTLDVWTMHKKLLLELKINPKLGLYSGNEMVETCSQPRPSNQILDGLVEFTQPLVVQKCLLEFYSGILCNQFLIRTSWILENMHTWVHAKIFFIYARETTELVWFCAWIYSNNNLKLKLKIEYNSCSINSKIFN